MTWSLITRKLHRWGAIVFALPLLVVILSGLLLQVKKQSDWVQPPSQRGTTADESPQQDWADILRITRAVPEAEVDAWPDIKRLYVEPGKGIVKVICKNQWEIQLDFASGEVLSSTRRRSDLIESVHDGSFFSDFVKLGVFLPNGIVLLVLWGSGLWLFYLPFRNRRNRKRAGSG